MKRNVKVHLSVDGPRGREFFVKCHECRLLQWCSWTDLLGYLCSECFNKFAPRISAD